MLLKDEPKISGKINWIPSKMCARRPTSASPKLMVSRRAGAVRTPAHLTFSLYFAISIFGIVSSIILAAASKWHSATTHSFVASSIKTATRIDDIRASMFRGTKNHALEKWSQCVSAFKKSVCDGRGKRMNRLTKTRTTTNFREKNWWKCAFESYFGTKDRNARRASPSSRECEEHTYDARRTHIFASLHIREHSQSPTTFDGHYRCEHVV